MKEEGFSSLTIIVPTLNEEKSIGLLLQKICALYPGVRAMVVDDCSSDCTKDNVLSEKSGNIVFIDRCTEAQKGLSASVLDGIGKCKTKYFIVMDADFQHPPKTIAKLYSALQECDFAIGRRSRVIDSWPIWRKTISRGAQWLAAARLFPKNCSGLDLMSGFFGMKTWYAKKIIEKNRPKFVPRGYKILFEFLKFSQKAKILSVDYDFGSRKFGKSKIGAGQIIAFIFSLLK